MIGLPSLIESWLVPTLVVGGAMLLLALLLFQAVRQPVQRRMIGATAIRVALLVPLLMLAPKWFHVRLPQQVVDSPARVEAPVAKLEVSSKPTGDESAPPSFEGVLFVLPARDAPKQTVVAPKSDLAPPAEDSTPTPSEPEPSSISWEQILVGLYACGAMLMLLHWLLGHVAVWCMLRRSRPAGKALLAVFDRAAQDAGVAAELRVAESLSGPVCCGLRRSVVLIPQRLAESSDEESLRWVFAHELAHLKRGDSWTALWFGLGQVLYFPFPWFWLLRSRVRLCQEFVADADAAAASQAEEYAAFLVKLSRSRQRRRQLAAVHGVLGTPSELFRRITMLLNPNSRVERFCPRRWSLLATGCFLALAVLLSGFGLSREIAAAPVEDPKDEKKEDPKKDKPEEPKKDKDEKPARPRFNQPRIAPVPAFDGGNPEEWQKQMQKIMEDMQRRLQQGFGGAMVFPQGGRNPFMQFGSMNSGSVRLGASIEKPHAALVEHLDLPKDQGVVLNEVKADSPAAKAGLKANDILLEINGKPVPSDPQEFRAMLKEIKADASVDAVILRKNRRETIKGIKLPEAKESDNPFGRGFQFQFPNIEIPNIELPNLPELPVPPPLPPAPPLPGIVDGSVNKSTSIQINNDTFTITSKDDGLGITIVGTIDDGKTNVSAVRITDGDKKVSAESIDKVPEKYRSKVQDLMKSIRARK